MTSAKVEEALGRLSVLKWFPVNPYALVAIAEIFRDLCPNDADGMALVQAMLSQFDEWEGPRPYAKPTRKFWRAGGRLNGSAGSVRFTWQRARHVRTTRLFVRDTGSNWIAKPTPSVSRHAARASGVPISSIGIGSVAARVKGSMPNP